MHVLKKSTNFREKNPLLYWPIEIDVFIQTKNLPIFKLKYLPKVPKINKS